MTNFTKQKIMIGIILIYYTLSLILMGSLLSLSSKFNLLPIFGSNFYFKAALLFAPVAVIVPTLFSLFELICWWLITGKIWIRFITGKIWIRFITLTKFIFYYHYRRASVKNIVFPLLILLIGEWLAFRIAYEYKTFDNLIFNVVSIIAYVITLIVQIIMFFTDECTKNHKILNIVIPVTYAIVVIALSIII